MGSNATISFGVVIADQSVPLAIALENLWAAEEKAKEHQYHSSSQIKNRQDCYSKKDAVQVRVLYGNGNILKATSKFDVFHQWQMLLNTYIKARDITPALFEQAVQLWIQHPAPIPLAIEPWTKAFCARRELFNDNDATKNKFQQHLAQFLNALWLTTSDKSVSDEIQNWLKLAAFVLRNREIKLGGQ